MAQTIFIFLFVCFFAVRGPPTAVVSPAAEHRLRTHRPSSHGSRAQLLRGILFRFDISRFVLLIWKVHSILKLIIAFTTKEVFVCLKALFSPSTPQQFSSEAVRWVGFCTKQPW